MNITEKLILGGLALMGALHFPGNAYAKSADSISDIIGQRMPAEPQPATVAVFKDLDGTPCKIVVGNAVHCHDGKVWRPRLSVPSASHDDDKRVALIYVGRLLDETDPNCAAYDALLAYQDDLMSDEIEPGALRELATLGRSYGIS